MQDGHQVSASAAEDTGSQRTRSLRAGMIPGDEPGLARSTIDRSSGHRAAAERALGDLRAACEGSLQTCAGDEAEAFPVPAGLGGGRFILLGRCGIVARTEFVRTAVYSCWTCTNAESAGGLR